MDLRTAYERVFELMEYPYTKSVVFPTESEATEIVKTLQAHLEEVENGENQEDAETTQND